jgi:hypothetical protein
MADKHRYPESIEVRSRRTVRSWLRASVPIPTGLVLGICLQLVGYVLPHSWTDARGDLLFVGVVLVLVTCPPWRLWRRG